MNNSLTELQQKIKDYTDKFNFRWSNYLEYIHLVEEVAELGEALTVHEGDRKAGSGEKALADHADPKEEIGDVLFTVLQLANQLKLDTGEIMEETFNRYDEKLKNLQEIQVK